MLFLNKVYNHLLDLCFPKRCVLCGDDMFPRAYYDYPVCNTCMDKVKPIEGERCIKCGISLISENNLCTRCRLRKYNFISNLPVFNYSGLLKELLYFYKFKGIKSLSGFFARVLGERINTIYPGLPLVPVPSSRGRRKKWGWDHIGVIASILKNKYRIEVLSYLRRTGDSPQKFLTYKQRLENLYDKIKGRNISRYNHAKVVLLDDIFTTGATADECSRILLRCGIKEVYVVTIAID